MERYPDEDRQGAGRGEAAAATEYDALNDRRRVCTRDPALADLDEAIHLIVDFLAKQVAFELRHSNV